MTRAIKTSLLALSLAALSSCGTSVESGVAKPEDFVALADLSSVNVASISLKTKNSSIAAGAGASGLLRATPKFAVSAGSAHEADFFTNDDFKYSTSSRSIIGHADTATSSYYLVNGSTSLGFVYGTDAPLVSHRSIARQMLVDDFSSLTSLYNQIKTYSSQSASEAGLSTLSVLYTNIDATVGYNCTTTKVAGDGSTTQYNYYITLDKLSSGYVFTDVIIRQKITSAAGGISYSNAEFNLTHLDALEKQVFNLASLSISKADLDLSSIPGSTVVSPAI